MRSIFLSVLLTFFVCIPVLAQEDENRNTLTLGESVTGEITDQNFEVEYTFEGDEGDVIAAFMRGTENSSFDAPQILLLNPEFDVIADTTSVVAVDGTRLISELPRDGEYTIIATRTDGRAGESVGEFSLNVFMPSIINYDSTLERETTNQQTIYSMLRTDSESMLEFEIQSGEFRPEITIATLDDNNSTISNFIVASGLTRGSLGILAPDTLYIVIASQPEFSYSFEELSATYTLNLISIDTED